MTNFSVVENKISSVKKYLTILQNFKKYTRKKIENDLNIKGAVEQIKKLI